MSKENFYNKDCIEGMKKHIDNDSVDLIFTDPPYGINGDKLDQHYNRKETNVIEGYIDVDKSKYQEFSNDWIKECERILRPSGSIYIISGYTCLREILNALNNTDLVEINHLIWQYSFGVYTKLKYVSSHYHILYYVKPPIKNKTFNTFCRFDDTKESYHDRIDVMDIPRKYKPGEKKNRNQLPDELIEKFISYSSKKEDMVFDPFLGSFSTARISQKLGRRTSGFELNKNAYDYFINTV